LKSFGIDQTITKVLAKPSDNDWKALFYLDKQLQALQQNELRGDFLRALMPHNDFKTKPALWLGLKAIALFDKEDALAYLAKIDTTVSFVTEDSDLLFQLGRCEDKFANYNKALEYHEKCLAIRLKTLGGEHPDVTVSYINIGSIWNYKGNYDKALEYYEKCLVIELKTLGAGHPRVAYSYNNIGDFLKNLEKYVLAIDVFKKGLSIHKVGGFPFKIAQCYEALDQFEEALSYYIQSAEIRKERLGLEATETSEAIANAQRLAKQLGKEKQLPKWIGK
jgi:tetratricopeptide (TPR) repeat protein